jgi:hypothetical protein
MRAYLIPFTLVLAACFGIQALALHASGGRTAKSESNYFSSLARLQAGSRGGVEIMLLGSSVTGRLPDQAAGFKGVANLGCDGGTAVDALRATDEDILPMVPCLVIEANYLHRALDPAPSEISQALRRPWFRVGIQFPLLSAYSRPSAFIYSTLLARKIGGFGDPAADEDLQVTSRPARLHGSAAEPLSTNERGLIDELVPLLHRLRQKGSRTVFVWLPPGREPGSPMPPWIAALVAESGSEWWDLGTEANREWVVLTDGAHMAAPSAARTVRSLRKGLGD